MGELHGAGIDNFCHFGRRRGRRLICGAAANLDDDWGCCERTDLLLYRYSWVEVQGVVNNAHFLGLVIANFHPRAHRRRPLVVYGGIIVVDVADADFILIGASGEGNGDPLTARGVYATKIALNPCIFRFFNPYHKNSTKSILCLWRRPASFPLSATWNAGLRLCRSAHGESDETSTSETGGEIMY